MSKSIKTVLFVPGFQENFTSRDYASTLKAIEDCGYVAEFVPINWSRTTIISWQQKLEKVYEDCDPAETILAGFSFGAVTALMTAAKRTPSELWLFSLSPYFKEDYEGEHMKQEWIDEIGIRRVSALSKLHFASIAPQITCPTKIFIGDREIKEYPIMGERYEHAMKLIPSCQGVIVASADHDVSNPNYVAAIASHV